MTAARQAKTELPENGLESGLSESTGGDTTASSITDLDVRASDADDPGGNAQVIRCRFAACDQNYGSIAYDDDAWNRGPAQRAIYHGNDRATSAIAIERVRCTPPATFAQPNVNFPPCGGL